MKRNYERIIDVLLGVLFVLLIYGFAKSIIFLDYRMGYYGEYEKFANVLFDNDIFLLAFTCCSLLLCFIYAILDFKKIKKGKVIQCILGLLLMGISAYTFIILCGLRDQAFSIDNYATVNAFSLYVEYRNFSLIICLSQFVISLHALIRSVFDYLSYRKEKKEEINE